MAMAVQTSTTKMEARPPNSVKVFTQVRQIATLHAGQHTDSIARGHGATDGTSDEMDFAARIRTAKHGPHHNVALHHQSDPAPVSEPVPSFPLGHDGHRSSDRSYRSGPSVESGSS